MQTILGAGGSIGIELAKHLPTYTKDIRLVSRNPKRVNASDELVKADLSRAEEVAAAVKGSDVVYLTVGLPYKAQYWEKWWPVVMKNAIEACKESGSKLVFFDNMYMYHPAAVPFMTEEATVKPVSRKGRVRETIANMLMEAHEKGDVQAAIARGADFYGPGIKNSVMLIAVVEKLLKGKKANWFVSTRFRHSFTYTPDAGKATAIIGNDSKAFGQVWHMPTASEPPSGEEWINAFAEEMGAKPRSQVASKGMVKFLGLFNPYMKEFYELLYQWDRDYIFDSAKFEKAYNFKPTSYASGIKEVAAESFKKHSS